MPCPANAHIQKGPRYVEIPYIHHGFWRFFFFKGMGFSISILLCCAQLGHRKTRETAICCSSWFRSANWPNQPSTWSFSFAPGHASEELWNAWSQCFFVPWFWWYLELESRDFPCLKQLWPFFFDHLNLGQTFGQNHPTLGSVKRYVFKQIIIQSTQDFY